VGLASLGKHFEVAEMEPERRLSAASFYSIGGRKRR